MGQGAGQVVGGQERGKPCLMGGRKGRGTCMYFFGRSFPPSPARPAPQRVGRVSWRVDHGARRPRSPAYPTSCAGACVCPPRPAISVCVCSWPHTAAPRHFGTILV